MKAGMGKHLYFRTGMESGVEKGEGGENASALPPRCHQQHRKS